MNDGIDGEPGALTAAISGTPPPGVYRNPDAKPWPCKAIMGVLFGLGVLGTIVAVALTSLDGSPRGPPDSLVGSPPSGTESGMNPTASPSISPSFVDDSSETPSPSFDLVPSISPNAEPTSGSDSPSSSPSAPSTGTNEPTSSPNDLPAPRVSITFMCKTTEAGVFFGESWDKDEFIFRLQEENDVDTSFLVNIAGTMGLFGNINGLETRYFSIDFARGGISVSTSPVSNEFSGSTGTDNEPACSNPFTGAPAVQPTPLDTDSPTDSPEDSNPTSAPNSSPTRVPTPCWGRPSRCQQLQNENVNDQGEDNNSQGNDNGR